MPAFKNNLYKPRDSSCTTEEHNNEFLIVNQSSINAKNERSITRDKTDVMSQSATKLPPARESKSRARILALSRTENNNSAMTMLPIFKNPTGQVLGTRLQPIENAPSMPLERFGKTLN